MVNKWIDNWTEDIRQLELELPMRHKNLFFHQDKNSFSKQIEDLILNLEKYNEYDIVVKIAKIVASFRDAHTTLITPASTFMPIEFFWFSEGIFIVDCSEKYKEYLNCMVTHINDIKIHEVIKKLEDIISHENNSFLKSQLPKYLPAAEILFGLKIIDDLNKIKLNLQDTNGNNIEVIIDTYKSLETEIQFVNALEYLNDDMPLFRRNKNQNYWYSFIEENSTLYFNYNYCKDMEGASVESFCSELMDFINKNEVDKLVVDLRNNLGGNSTLLDPFIRDLRQCKKLNRKGGIFVILGRNTFSSALLNAYSFKDKTKAIFVGEATGGMPNCYGEVQYFELNNSKLMIRYSTKFYKIIKNDKQLSFFPDIKFDVTHEDYINKVDPCIEYILSLGKLR